MLSTTLSSPVFCRVTLTLAFVLCTASASWAQWQVGVLVEHSSSVQPGVEVGYQSQRWLGGRPRLGVSYSTTRLTSARVGNDLRKDRVQFAVGWVFRPQRQVRPYLQAEAGYVRYDRPNGDVFAMLDNDAWNGLLVAGIRWQATPRIVGYVDAGLAAPTSATEYHLATSVGVNVLLR